MAIKTFTDLTTLPASDINTYLANSGLVFVGEFTASGTSRALVCDNIFSDEYTHYRLMISMRSTIATNALFYQTIDSGGTALNTNYWSTAYGQSYAGAGTAFSTLGATSVAYLGWIPNSTINSVDISLDIMNPFSTTVATSHMGNHAGLSSGFSWLGGVTLMQRIIADRNRGIRIDNGGAGNLTGKVTVYGYRNA